MKLTDLDGHFLGEVEPNGSCKRVDSLDGAQGVMFQCPKCAAGQPIMEEDGRKFVVGAHYVICWFKNPRMLHKYLIILIQNLLQDTRR